MFGMRMVRLAAAGLLAAAALASGTADAFAGTTRDERNLAPPATSTTGAAEGVVEAKETTKKRTLRVEVKNLAPKRRYEVRRGGESGEVLDTFKTNRKGKGTGKVKEDAPAPAEEAPRDERNVSRSHLAWNPFAGNGGVGALDGGTGDDPRDDSGNPGYGYGYGYGNYYDYELPDWDDFFPPGGYDYYFPPFPGDDYYYIPYLPYYPYYGYCYEEPVEEECDCDWYCISVYDSETGECVLECTDESHGKDDGSDDRGDDGEGKCEFPILEDYAYAWADYCGEDGTYGSLSMTSSTFEGEAVEDFYFSFMVPVHADCWWTDWSIFEFYANETTGLPLGVTSVKDLEGRALEVRDADGNVVLSGEVPTMEIWGDMPWYGPSPLEGGRPGLEGEAGGYTLWIADEEGDMQEVGDLLVVEYDYYYPAEGDGSGDGQGHNGLLGAPAGHR